MEQSFSNKHRYLILINVIVSVFMATLDSSIVNIALPTITASYGIGVSEVQWVVTSYMVTIALLLLVYGKLADRYGNRSIFAFGIALFTVGSLMCGMATSFPMLIASRVVQAAGAAATMALSQGIITHVFEPRERGKALGLTGTTVALGSLVGPSMGGLITQALGWKYIFLVNIPIGMIGLAMTMAIMPSAGSRTARTGIREDLGLLSIFEFRRGLAVSLMSFMAMSAAILFIPFYLQVERGMDPATAGLVMSINPAATALMSPFAGHLSDRFSHKPLTLSGLGINAMALLAISTFTSETPISVIAAALVVLGLGVAMFQSPNTKSVMSSVPRSKLGIAGGISALARTIGLMAGAYISVVIFTAVSGSAISGPESISVQPLSGFIDGFSWVIRVFSAIMASAFILMHLTYRKIGY